jgi:hypothetical protein
MPASDILNPKPEWEEDIEDSMCPDYGFTRKRASTQLNKKAVGGTPWTRETANTGHTFSFSWMQRSWLCVQRLKWYYEQYEDGYFTIIDHDGGGRHYVGRFTTEVSPTEVGNGMYDVQNVTFEEMPEAEMLKYPDDWDHDAIRVYSFNDFGDQKLAPYSSQTEGWAVNARTIFGQSVVTMDNPGAAGNAGDWACYEYRGYGFKLYLMGGPEFGQCEVFLDAVQVGGTIDCYEPEDIGPKMVLMDQNVNLDIHRVQVNVLGTKNASASAATISWHSLEVMR